MGKSAQKKLWNDLQKLINQQVPIIVPIQSEVVTAMQKNVEMCGRRVEVSSTWSTPVSTPNL